MTPYPSFKSQGLCETFDVALYVSPFRASDLAELVTFDGEGNMLRGTTAAEFGRIDTRRSLLGSRAAEGQKDTRRLNAGVTIPALAKLPSNSGIRGKSGHLGAGLGIRPLAGGALRDPKKPLRFIIVRTFCPWDIDKLEVPLFPIKHIFMIQNFNRNTVRHHKTDQPTSSRVLMIGSECLRATALQQLKSTFSSSSAQGLLFSSRNLLACPHGN